MEASINNFAYTETIGLLAAFLTTIAFIPQVYQAWKTNSVEDISLTMYILFVLGLSLWLIYGLLLSNRPIIVANTITLALACSTLFLKIKMMFKK